MAKSKKSSDKAKPVVRRRMRLRSDSRRIRERKKKQEEERARAASSASSSSQETDGKGTNSSRSSNQSTESRSTKSSSTYGSSSSRSDISTGSSKSGRSSSDASKSSEETVRKIILKKGNKNRHVVVPEKARPRSEPEPKKRSESPVEEKRGSGSGNDSVASAHGSEDSRLNVSKIATSTNFLHSPDSRSGRTSTPIKRDPKKETLYKRSILNRANNAAQSSTAPTAPAALARFAPMPLGPDSNMPLGPDSNMPLGPDSNIPCGTYYDHFPSAAASRSPLPSAAQAAPAPVNPVPSVRTFPTPVSSAAAPRSPLPSAAQAAPVNPVPSVATFPTPVPSATAPPTPNSVDRSQNRPGPVVLEDGGYCNFKLPIFVESIQKINVSPKEEKITIETKTILVSSDTTHEDQEKLFKVRPAIAHVNTEQEQGRNEEVSEQTVLVGKNTVLFHRTTVLKKSELNNNLSNTSKKEYNRAGRCKVNELSGPLSIHCAQGTMVVDDIYQKKELISVFLAAEPQIKKKEELEKILSNHLIREEIPEISTERVKTAEKLMSTGKYVLMLEREVRIQCNNEMWTNENDYVTTEKRSFEFGKNPHGEMSIIETGHNMSKSILDMNPSFFNRSAQENTSTVVPRVVPSPSMVQNNSLSVNDSHYETASLNGSRFAEQKETPHKTQEQKNVTPAKMGTTPKAVSPIPKAAIAAVEKTPAKEAVSPVVAKSPGTTGTENPKKKTPEKPAESKTINDPTSFRGSWTTVDRTQSSTSPARSRSLSPSTMIERIMCQKDFWKQPTLPRTPIQKKKSETGVTPILRTVTKEAKPVNKESAPFRPSLAPDSPKKNEVSSRSLSPSSISKNAQSSSKKNNDLVSRREHKKTVDPLCPDTPNVSIVNKEINLTDSKNAEHSSTVGVDVIAEINGEPYKLRTNYKITSDSKEIKFVPKKISIDNKAFWQADTNSSGTRTDKNSTN